MEPTKKSIEINATSATVWDVIVKPEHLKKWAAAFAPGTTAETTWEQGTTVLWRDGQGNVGAKGQIEENSVGSVLLVRYWDLENADESSTLGEYFEKYELVESGGKTKLTVEYGDMGDEHRAMHDGMWDKAIAIVKNVAEGLKN